MSNTGAPIQVTAGAPPRGDGIQPARTFAAQTMRGSFAWGGSPATATLTYVGDAPVTTGALVNFKIGSHYFAGICKSDTDVNGSNGRLRHLEFNDLRYFLTWDWVFGAFNLPDVRLVNGVRLKRYKHMYPRDYGVQRWTYTWHPLPAWQILDACLRAPTVFTAWQCNLTGNGLFPAGLLNGAVYEIDCLSGLRLDALLNLICDKTGLLFCHDPVSGIIMAQSNGLQVGPGVVADWRLTFTRKGFGLLPLPFPRNADQQREGVSLTENPTNVCVLGDRNLYQMLEVPMTPDWAAAWEKFIELDLLSKDLFDNEINPANGVRYNDYSAANAGGDDPEHWRGANDAKTRALEITVGQYVALRNARDGLGDAFMDLRKYAGRWRMDLPASLYIERLLFRAFKPACGYVDNEHNSPTYGQLVPGITNVAGNFIPLDCADIMDQLLCRVYCDPVTGAMSVDDPPTPGDGNGVLVAKGYQVGEDLFRLVQPDRINEDFFNGATRLWSQVQFQIDDSGEGVRFVIADAPVFVSPPSGQPGCLLLTVDDCVVLNAGAVLLAPPVQAALVFAGERFTYWKGRGLMVTGAGWVKLDPAQPLPGRNRVEPVNGLNQEFVVDAAGNYTEVLYADNTPAAVKAQLIADSLLQNQAASLAGGYELKWDPVQLQEAFGTPLAPGNSSCFDRIEISAGPGGVMEVVDFTTERQRDMFEPERELDRRSLQNSLFPGQRELQEQARDQKRFNAVLRQTPERLFTLFRKLLRGEVDGNLFPVKFIADAPGLPATLPCGAPLVQAGLQPANGRVAQAPSAIGADDKVFLGVTTRENEPTGGQFYVQSQGDAPCRVKGPVAVNDPVGLGGAGAPDYLVKGGSPVVGLALEASDKKVADGAGKNPGDGGYVDTYGVKLIKCRLGQGGSGATQDFLMVSDGGDYYNCHTWDGVTAGTDIVKVAKHQELRCKKPTDSPAGGAYATKLIRGVTYTYTYAASAGTTTDGVNVVEYSRAVSGSDNSSETDYVTPCLNVGDVITARSASYTVPATLAGVVWQALADGRAWAKQP